MRRRLAALAPWAALALFASCADPSTVLCEDGLVCPAGTVCTQLPTRAAGASEICAAPEDLTACADGADAACGEGRVCHDGVCMATACGNGYVDPTEACDDGNNLAGDGCSADCASTEACGNGVLDGVRFEQCDDGNLISNDGCDSTCRPEQPRWVELGVGAMGAREGATMAYDAARDRTVLFGGFHGTEVLGDTWLWNGAGWSRAAPGSSPNARSGHAMAYDPIHRQIVLFGGEDAGKQYLGDTWVWDGATWTVATPPVAPLARAGASMAWDGALGKIVLFGGVTYNGLSNGIQVIGDTWLWDGATWTQVSGTGPAPRAGAALAYDPARDRVVLFGGCDHAPPFNTVWPYDTCTGALDGDTWAFDGQAWTHVASGGPSPRFGARMAWDATGGDLVLFGGRGPTSELADTFRWTGTAWSSVTAAGPNARTMYALAEDPRRGVVTLAAGSSDTAASSTWAWDGASWHDVTPVPTPDLTQVDVDYDLRRGRAVLGTFGTVYELDGGAWHTSAGVTNLYVDGLAYDVASSTTVVLAGEAPGGSLAGTTWTYDGATWSQTSASPATSPAPRETAFAYDAHRDRVVLFGGRGDGLLDDTWEWDGTQWEHREPAHRPAPRIGAAIAYDWIRQRVVLFGGEDLDTLEQFGDTWTWDGVDWHEEPTALAPRPRFGAAMTWNPRRGKLTLFGGANLADYLFFDDTWEWDGSAWTQLAIGSPPSARLTSMVRSGDGIGLAIFSGTSATADFTDTWELRWDGPDRPETCTAPIDDDGDGLAGCDDLDCFAACHPTCLPGAACDAAAPHCGDGVCAPLESCRMCPGDCGACPAVCGDTYCDAGETSTTCPGDCH